MKYKDKAITRISKKGFNYFFEKVKLKDKCKYVFPMMGLYIIFDVKTGFYYKHGFKEFKIKEIQYTFDDYLEYINKLI